MKQAATFMVLLTLSYQTNAIDFEKKQNVLGVGMSFGGDTLTNAGDDELNAGEELSLYYGRVFQIDSENQIQVSLGYKDDLVEGLNGDVAFSRIPLELIALKRYGMHRLGVGLTYHINPTFEQNISGSSGELVFDNTLGLLVQFEFIGGGFVSTGIRYERIEYSTSWPVFFPGIGSVTNKVEGNNFGFYVGLHL